MRATLGLKPDQDETDLEPLQVPSVSQEKVLWDEAQAYWERAEALSRQTAISNEELQQRKAPGGRRGRALSSGPVPAE